MLVHYATGEISAILVNLNLVYRIRELDYVLTQSELAMVIVASNRRTSDYTTTLTEVAPYCLGLSYVVFTDIDRWDELAGTEADPNCVYVDRGEAAKQLPINIQCASGTKPDIRKLSC